MYIQVMNAMRRTERTIISQEVDETQILVARKPCYKLYDTLGDIEFKLQDTKIIIKPRGYLYHMENQDDCFIGIQAIPESANQYRLGTIFLRNFYTALDYEQNLIIIGVNAGASDLAKAEIDGKVYNPFKESSKGNEGGIASLLFIFLLIIIVIIAFWYFMKQEEHKQKEMQTKPPKIEDDEQEGVYSLNKSIAEEMKESLADAEKLD